MIEPGQARGSGVEGNLQDLRRSFPERWALGLDPLAELGAGGHRVGPLRALTPRRGLAPSSRTPCE